MAGVTGASVNYTTAKSVIEAADDKMTIVVSTEEKIVKKIEPRVAVKNA